MRLINFALIFLFCLVMLLFGIENTQVATVKIVEGVEFPAPLSLELFLAMGLGAFLAWMFGVWARLQRFLAELPTLRQLRKQKARIEQLEQNIEGFKVEMQEQQRLLTSSEPYTTEASLTNDVSPRKAETR
ncbi:LapA family protein [Kamptonema formosum]|uniref:LapA family protein n=1 Tax=Kamptonema formosum TaxID=331992 RepID=UPI00034C5CD8|nr:LapA family protein [Oscillatoria sp. PCC 10802]